MAARGRDPPLAAPHLDFPRDPEFAPKAGRILDLYARQWDGQALTADDFVLSADEKTSIQARLRTHPSTPPRPGQPMHVEHEYARGGLGVLGRARRPSRQTVRPVRTDHGHRAVRPPGDTRHDPVALPRGAPRLLDCRQRVLASWRRVRARLQTAFPNLMPVHGPIHASWLNQIEIYFSIVQRKALTPNDFSVARGGRRPPLGLPGATTRASRRRSNGASPRTTSRHSCANSTRRHRARRRGVAEYVAELMNHST